MTNLTGFPCYCMAILAKAEGVSLYTLLAEQDQTCFWQHQYAFDFTASMLSTANVWLRTPASELHMPAALPNPAGRPKTSRYKGAQERAQGKRPAGADKKARQTYQCKICKQPKKGHTCPGKQ